MDLKVTQIPKSETETLEIRCHKVSDEVREIVSFIKSRQGEKLTEISVKYPF